MSFRRDSYSIFQIGDLFKGKVQVDVTPVLFSEKNFPISFVKIYGVITDKGIDERYSSSGSINYLLKVDDGTGSIWINSSNPKSDALKKWDFVRTIGSISINTSTGLTYEIGINADIIVKVDQKTWELVHILEVQRASSKSGEKIKPPQKITQKEPSISDDKINQKLQNDQDDKSDETEVIQQEETLVNKIERILRENDTGQGVEFSFILKMIGSEVEESEVDDVLFELAFDGKVYQPRPDFYRIMD